MFHTFEALAWQVKEMNYRIPLCTFNGNFSSANSTSPLMLRVIRTILMASFVHTHFFLFIPAALNETRWNVFLIMWEYMSHDAVGSTKKESRGVSPPLLTASVTLLTEMWQHLGSSWSGPHQKAMFHTLAQNETSSYLQWHDHTNFQISHTWSCVKTRCCNQRSELMFMNWDRSPLA